MSAKSEFVALVKEGKILARRCISCLRMHLATVYFCQGCGGRKFEKVTINGTGTISTYTIITVPPAGFEEYAPYAWVVLKLDGYGLRVSGFMKGIGTPDDLPVGTPAAIVGFNDCGIMIKKR